MRVPDPTTLRRAFLNSSRSKAASMTLPTDWPPPDADERDLIGWVDPKAPRRGYLVAELDGGVVALELRIPPGPAAGRATMCDLCRTQDDPDGARLVVAARAGARGRDGDTVGLYVCSDFDCSRRARTPLKGHQVSVTGQPDRRVEELVDRLRAFVERVRA